MNTERTTPTSARRLVLTEWVTLTLVAATLLGAAVTVLFASSQVPLMWNLQGKVSIHAPPAWGLFVWPVGMIIFFGIWLWMETRDPGFYGDANTSATPHARATRVIRNTVALMMAAVCVSQWVCAVGGRPDLGRFGPMALPVLAIIVGNYFGKLRPNHHVGIRLPWTLASETVWRKTHRAAGWLYSVSGFAMIVYALFAERHHPGITWCWLSIIMVVPVVLAWRYHRDEALASQSSF